MTIYQFQWPHLGNIPVFIIDPNSKKLFSEEQPLPSNMLDLNIPENRYIKLSAAIKLFPSSLMLEADEILKELITNFKLEDKITVPTFIENRRQVITFLPITTFLAFLIIWPHCQSFKKVRNILFTYLDNYSDSVCIDCGYIKQHCICEKLHAGIKKTNFIGTGFGIKVIDKGCQVMISSKSTDYSNIKENKQISYLNHIIDTNNKGYEQYIGEPIENQISILNNCNNILMPMQNVNMTSIESQNHCNPMNLIQGKANNISLPFILTQLPDKVYDISVGINISNQDSKIYNIKNPEKNLDIRLPNNNNNNLNKNNELVEIEKAQNNIPIEETKKNSKLWRLIDDGENISDENLLSNNKINSIESNNNMDNNETQNLAINLQEGKNILKDNNANIDKLLNKIIYDKFEYMPTGEHILKCTITKCGQCFDTKDAADMHCKVHTKNDANQYTCPQCNFKAPFFNWFNIVRHLRSAHEQRIGCDFYSCKLCGLAFENEDALINHLDFHYSNRYKCIYCGLLLLTWNQVKKHVDQCSEKHRGNVSLGCPYCTFIFHKKNIRNIHLLSHCDEGVSCAICQDDKPWNDWKDLRKHYQSKHPKILAGRITPFRHDLPIKKKPPMCKLCNVDFKSYDLYVSHMTRAHDFVPYTLIECTQCEKKFRSEKSYDWHVKHVHIIELNCDKCSYSTSSQTLLKLHFTQKHSDKQHMCTQCDKSFAYFHQLKVHLAHHASRTGYICEICEQEFTRSSDLKQHQTVEHSGKEIQNGVLDNHIKENHTTQTNNLETRIIETRTRLRSATHEQDLSPPPSKHAKLSEENISGKQSDEPLSSSGYSKRIRKTRYDQQLIEEQSVDIDDSRIDHADKYLLKKQRVDEEHIRRLHKTTCARTRTYEQHRHERLKSDQPRDIVIQHFSSSDDNTIPKYTPPITFIPKLDPVSASLMSEYPYLDHCYFKVDHIVNAIHRAEGAVSLQLTPPTSASYSLQLNDARRKFSNILESVSSQSSQKLETRSYNKIQSVDDYDLDNLSSEITDLDVLAENELLKSTGGYNLIQDILSCAPVNNAPVRNNPTANTMDLDDIELCEDDYNLFHQKGKKPEGSDNRSFNDNHSYASKSPSLKSPGTSGLLSLSQAAMRLHCYDSELQQRGVHKVTNNFEENFYQNNYN